MDIWLIQIGETLPIKRNIRRIRTAYLADELVKRGNKVVWWGSAFDHFQKEWISENQNELSIHQNYKIKLIKGIGYKKNISLSRFIDHRIIALKFRKLALKEKRPDIIVASFPSYDLAYEAVQYAQKNHVPIIVDIRDQWPDIFLDHVPKWLKPVLKQFLIPEFKMVKNTLTGATAITSVMELFLDWGVKYANRLKRETDRVFYLGCKPSGGKKRILHFSSFDEILKHLNQKFVVTFIGTFSHYHNPSILVECAKKMAHNPNIHFVLAGDGHNMPKIKKAAEKLNNITLPGWVNQAEIEQILQCSDVGICTTTQTASLFPNKAFAYFSAGLPVISAFQGDLRKIIKKKRIGYYYPPNNVDVLCSHIENLSSNPFIYKKMSIEAKKAFNDCFNADLIYETYSEYISDIKNNF